MRIPLLHSLWDDRPIERWEWLFWPVIVPPAVAGMMVWGILAAFYFMVYPENYFHEYDWGTAQQQNAIDRCRRQLKRISVWKKWRRRVALLRHPRPHAG